MTDKTICPHCGNKNSSIVVKNNNIKNYFLNSLDDFYHSIRSNLQYHEEKSLKELINRFKTTFEINTNGNVLPYNTSFLICSGCEGFVFLIGDKIIYPRTTSIPDPNNDLNNDIKYIYLEARAILNESPRGSAALLRLALQKLCVQLGEKGKNINEDIKSLVENGLSVQLQQAMDSLRVVGNEAVHPGTIDFKDNKDIAKNLFTLINIIAEKMITEPKRIKDFYEEVIPDDKKTHIEKRDNSK